MTLTELRDALSTACAAIDLNDARFAPEYLQGRRHGTSNVQPGLLREAYYALRSKRTRRYDVAYYAGVIQGHLVAGQHND